MHRVTGIFNRIVVAIFAMSIAMTWSALVAAKSELAPASIGEVTMVLGKTTIASVTGSSVPAKVGMAIHVGDTIETAGSGQVHIRFVDDAYMSVRPMSTLQVVRYDYNPQNPQNSAIKLKLVEGITREISGQGATKARQNFRMDTPIAAIGVRGTDFAVSANGQSVRAIVNEGAIVVAPYSSQCSAAALGPCSQNAVELSGLSRQILEMNASTAGISSALLPASNAQAQALMAEASVKADNANKSPTKAADAKDLYTDTVTSRAVNTTLASSETVKPVVPPVVTPPPPVVVVPSLAPEFTPAAAQTVAALTTNTQMVWGRWTVGNLDNERITVSADVAIGRGLQAAGNDNSGKYGLFRAENPGQMLQPGLGVLAFNLSKAQANFT